MASSLYIRVTINSRLFLVVASDTPEKLGQYMKSSDVMELRIRGSAEACEKAKRLLEKAIKGLEIQTTTASLEEVLLELT